MRRGEYKKASSPERDLLPKLFFFFFRGSTIPLARLNARCFSFVLSFFLSFLTALDSILYSERDGALGEGAAMREQLTTLTQQLADHAAKELQAEEENQREVSQSIR